MFIEISKTRKQNCIRFDGVRLCLSREVSTICSLDGWLQLLSTGCPRRFLAEQICLAYFCLHHPASPAGIQIKASKAKELLECECTDSADVVT